MCVINLAELVDERVVKKRRNPGVEILGVSGIDFCGELYGDARSLGDFDCTVWPLFGRNPPKKGQIVSPFWIETAPTEWPVVPIL